MRLIPKVASATTLWATRPTLNVFEVALLRDLANGAAYSLKYSPAAVRSDLRALIAARCAHVPYQEIDGVVVDLVCITDYGEEALK
jgi:hypothetical protein